MQKIIQDPQMAKDVKDTFYETQAPHAHCSCGSTVAGTEISTTRLKVCFLDEKKCKIYYFLLQYCIAIIKSYLWS